MADFKTVFLDTNIYLHYQRFDQVNWLNVFQAKGIRIIVPPVTARELNKIKDTHPLPQIRKRAGDITQRLWGLFSASDVATLREGVEIHLLSDDPLIDFAYYHLSRDVQDDHLIASIITYQQDNDEKIFLVTSDAGILLMGKARRQGLQVVPCPDNLKLPILPDPEQAQIRELQTELNKLKNRLPKLGLVFEDGGKRAEFSLNPLADITPDEIEVALEEIKQKYPKCVVPASESHTDQDTEYERFFGRVAAYQNPLFTISSGELIEYNKELDAYYEEYVKYLKAQRAFEMTAARSLRIDIQLINNGTAPAEDVDIFLHFPDGFTLLSEEELPEPPELPQPPSHPVSEMERITYSLANPLANYEHLLRINQPDIPYLGPPPNVSAPNIRRTNSYDVDMKVQKVKHNLPESLDPLLLIFDNFESATSFSIEYTLFTDDLPDKVSDKLHVIIQK